MSLTKTLGLERGLQDLLVVRNDSLSVLDGNVVGRLDLVKLDVGMSESTGDVEGSLENEGTNDANGKGQGVVERPRREPRRKTHETFPLRALDLPSHLLLRSLRTHRAALNQIKKDASALNFDRDRRRRRKRRTRLRLTKFHLSFEIPDTPSIILVEYIPPLPSGTFTSTKYVCERDTKRKRSALKARSRSPSASLPSPPSPSSLILSSLRRNSPQECSPHTSHEPSRLSSDPCSPARR